MLIKNISDEKQIAMNRKGDYIKVSPGKTHRAHKNLYRNLIRTPSPDWELVGARKIKPMLWEFAIQILTNHTPTVDTHQGKIAVKK